MYSPPGAQSDSPDALSCGAASADTLREIYELALETDAQLKAQEATYRANLEVEIGQDLIAISKREKLGLHRAEKLDRPEERGNDQGNDDQPCPQHSQSCEKTNGNLEWIHSWT